MPDFAPYGEPDEPLLIRCPVPWCLNLVRIADREDVAEPCPNCEDRLNQDDAYWSDLDLFDLVGHRGSEGPR